jgi:hypothetical protein
MNMLAATLFALALSTAAMAQQPGTERTPEQRPAARQERQPQRMPTFEAADKNKDGSLSRQEASAIPGLDFAAADTNKNQSLDLSEYMAAIARFSPSPRG